MNTQEVSFNGTTLLAVMHNGVPHVAIKPICEAIGLDWNAQYQRICRDEILNSTMCMTHMVAADGKNREMLTLPLKYLNGWMFGVDEAKVNPSVKSTLLEYKRECYDVLHNHFTNKTSVKFLKAGDKGCQLHYPTLRQDFEQFLQDGLRLGYTRTEALQRANLAFMELTGLNLGTLVGFPDFNTADQTEFRTLPEIAEELGMNYTKAKPWMILCMAYLGLISSDRNPTVTTRGEWHSINNRDVKLDQVKWDKYVIEDLKNTAEMRKGAVPARIPAAL